MMEGLGRNLTVKSVPIRSVLSFTTADLASSRRVLSGGASRRTDLEDRYHGMG